MTLKCIENFLVLIVTNRQLCEKKSEKFARASFGSVCCKFIVSHRKNGGEYRCTANKEGVSRSHQERRGERHYSIIKT